MFLLNNKKDNNKPAITESITELDLKILIFLCLTGFFTISSLVFFYFDDFDTHLIDEILRQQKENNRLITKLHNETNAVNREYLKLLEEKADLLDEIKSSTISISLKYEKTINALKI